MANSIAVETPNISIPFAASKDANNLHDGDTFTIKTLKSMIETQAKWTTDDLVRLRFVR